jgi:hypothetical protein
MIKKVVKFLVLSSVLVGSLNSPANAESTHAKFVKAARSVISHCQCAVDKSISQEYLFSRYEKQVFVNNVLVTSESSSNGSDLACQLNAPTSTVDTKSFSKKKNSCSCIATKTIC